MSGAVVRGRATGTYAICDVLSLGSRSDGVPGVKKNNRRAAWFWLGFADAAAHHSALMVE